jgi:histone acetyltransferase (RNA polymerase elongator complex component)
MKTCHYTIPIFIPQLACPFQCVFCNQEKITSRGHIPDVDEVRSTIEDHLASFPKGNKHVEIGFFGGNFTGIPPDEQEKYLQVVQPYLESGVVQGLRLSTRPDYISFEGLHPSAQGLHPSAQGLHPSVQGLHPSAQGLHPSAQGLHPSAQGLHLLKMYGVTTIELGAQSMDDDVLRKSARGHTAQDVEMASRMILSAGFRLGLQMMVGLPGDTLEKAVYTTRKIIELGASETRIYPVLIIRGTKLAEWYEKGKYSPLSLDEAVFRVKTILPLFDAAEVEVTRVGLHSSEGLLSGKELVAGPFHTSIRELAMTEVWWDRLSYLLKEELNGKIRIAVHPSQYNFAIGYYGKNRNRLLDHFLEVTFRKDPLLGRNEFNIE